MGGAGRHAAAMKRIIDQIESTGKTMRPDQVSHRFACDDGGDGGGGGGGGLSQMWVRMGASERV